jgi:hypothetical protein
MPQLGGNGVERGAHCGADAGTIRTAEIGQPRRIQAHHLAFPLQRVHLLHTAYLKWRTCSMFASLAVVRGAVAIEALITGEVIIQALLSAGDEMEENSGPDTENMRSRPLARTTRSLPL